MSTQRGAEQVVGRPGAVLAQRGQAGRTLHSILRFGRTKPLGAVCCAIIVALLLVAAFPELLAPFAYDELNIPQALHGPSATHPFGTDDQGRDVLSRIIYGTRTSIVVSFGAVLLSAVLATAVGMLSAYYGGLFDLLGQRVVDVWQAFPGLIFIVFIVSVFQPGTGTLVISLGLLFAAGSSRLVRATALSVMANPYVEAARSLGAGSGRIMLRHVLPNIVPIVIVNATVQVGYVIVVEASLSFLGLGVPPPFPSWGRMLQDAQVYMTRHPYLAFFPGAAIAITVYASNIAGDALRDVLDPRLRGR
jgi:peptide/nickel transport system permease protein